MKVQHANAAPTSARSSVVFARAEEVARLQDQVNDLKKLIESFTPFVPLMTSLQDYFQQVECEASRQSTRLRRASEPAAAHGVCDADLAEPRLELTRWLQLATAAVAPAVAGSVESVDGPSQSMHGGSGWSPRMEVPLSENKCSARGLKQQTSLKLPENCMPSPAPTRAPSVISSMSPSSISSSSWFEERSPAAWSLSSPTWFGFGAKDVVSGMGSKTSVSLDKSTSSPSSLSDSESNEEHGGSSRIEGVAVFPSMVGGAASECPAVAVGSHPDAEIPSKDLAIRSEALIKGKGAWAKAYQESTGCRRDALYLLCMCGIVTTREVSDDLTAIKSEHIDDCISVATEMLGSLPHVVWTRQPKEANKFFEGRFTALYKQKYARGAAFQSTVAFTSQSRA